MFQHPPRRINVKSFAMDGSVFNAIIEDKVDSGIIERNRDFIDTLILEFDDGNYAEWVTFLGSSKDAAAASNYNLTLLNQEFNARTHGVRLDPYALANTSKAKILYAQIHKMASENPHAHLVFDFYDETRERLANLHELYENNKDLIPLNVCLRLNQYSGNRIELLEPIRGTSEKIDYLYEKNIRLMERLDLKSFKAQRQCSSLYHDFQRALQGLLPENFPMENHTSQDNLITALEKLGTDLKIQNPQFSAITHPKEADIAAAAITLMVNLKSNPQDENAVHKFENYCQKNSGWERFLQAIKAVIVAAVGFVLGAVIGGGIGILAGSWSGPGAVATGLVGLVQGSITGASLALATSSVATGLFAGTFAASFFKPSYTVVADEAREFAKTAEPQSAVTYVLRQNGYSN